jgi:GntR family transcriptional regulator
VGQPRSTTPRLQPLAHISGKIRKDPGTFLSPRSFITAELTLGAMTLDHIVRGDDTVQFANRPLYRQVRDALAERIASGGLPPGAAIPSEDALAREIGVSAGTVRKALQLMETDRLIVRRQGRGTFVSDPSSDALAARFTRLHGPDGVRLGGQIKAVEVVREVAGELQRTRLRLSTGTEVYRVRRVRHYNGAAFMVEDATLPVELFAGLDERDRIADPITVLAQEYGLLLGNAQERVSAVVPPADIAPVLHTAPDMPVVVLDRVVFTIDNLRPVEWRLAHSHLPGSYYLADLR